MPQERGDRSGKWREIVSILSGIICIQDESVWKGTCNGNKYPKYAGGVSMKTWIIAEFVIQNVKHMKIYMQRMKFQKICSQPGAPVSI